jgi:membrane-associated phospholipid phosphatase
VNALARIISVVFHPLLLVTYLLLLLAYFLPSALYPVTIEGTMTFILFMFVLTFVLPVLNIAMFRVLGAVQSFTLEKRVERVRPFLLIALLYCFVTYLFYSKWRVGMDDGLLRLLLIIDCLVVLAAIITIFYKISIHSMGVTGLLGILLPLNKAAENNLLLVPTIITIVIAGVVMSSRLQLNSHTPREVMVGSVVGFSTGFFGMIILF